MPLGTTPRLRRLQLPHLQRQLLDHGAGLEAAPVLDALAVRDADDVDGVEAYDAAGGRHAVEMALVGAGEDGAGAGEVALAEDGDLLEAPVGEGLPQGLREGADAVGAVEVARTARVLDAVAGDQLVDRGEVA